jgi:thioredoxin-related protein
MRLEGRTNMELVRQFHVTGAPTTLLFSPDGEEKHRFVGFQPAEEYLKELAKVV